MRIILPFAAGGLPDNMMRMVTPRLSESLKQPFVIDNRPGAGGIGSLHHLTMEALSGPLKLGLINVPYKGTAQSVPAMLSGEVSLATSALPLLAPHRAGGRIKLQAVNTLKRATQALDAPTVAEVTGLKDFDYSPVIGILAPAATPRAIVNHLSDAIAQAVRHPEVAQRYTTLGIDPVGSTPEEYAEQNRADFEKYAKAVRAAGVKAE